MILSMTTTFSLACDSLVTGAVPVLHHSSEKDQDTNHDRQPDDWTRRKCPKFPSYIETGIDRNQPGESVGQSLRFKVNGGRATIYSLKYPLWQSVYSDDQELPDKITQLFSSLVAHRITPVSLLNNPSLEMRNKFARDWTGISKIFTMPSSFWLPPLEPVIARYSSNVRYWQLGGESDASFVGMKSRPEALANVKSEIDRIGRDTRIGLHWDWKTPLPSSSRMPRTFLSVSSDPPMDEWELLDTLRSSARSGLPRWVLLKPFSRTKHTPQERVVELLT